MQGVGGPVSSIVLQADGKVLVSGNFSSVNGVGRGNIARINADGSLDTTFQNGMSGVLATTYGYGTAVFISLQADGKIFVSGFFDVVNGVARHHVARLNNDGSLDTSFPDISQLMSSLGATGPILIQPDGKLLIPQNGGFARFNADGTRELVVTNSGGIIYSLSLQPDGKIIEGGVFNTANSVPRVSIARLNANGSLDTTFQNGMAGVAGPVGNGRVYSTIMQANGKILIGGDFQFVNGVAQMDFARLNADGTFDNALHLGRPGLADGSIHSIVVQPDGKSIVGGEFDFCVYRHGIARLNADGSMDTTFQNGMAGISSLLANSVQSVVLQPDGKVLVGGNFDSVNGISRNNIARLNADGGLDDNFQNGMSGIPVLNNYVYSVALQADGKVLVGGAFNSVNGVPRSGIARLNTDGSLDTTFQNGMTGINSVRTVVVQPDGKIVVGGHFNFVNGIPRNNIARLNTDGSLDDNFQNGMAGVGYAAGYPTVFSVAVQADGKVLIGGDFDSVNEISRTGIARLRTDGSLDTDFQNGMEGPQTGDFYYTNFYNGSVSSIAMQADGKVLVGGSFEFFDGVPRSGIARLNSDGGLDLSFLEGMAGIGRFGSVQSVGLQNDGKVIIGAAFNTTVNGLFASGLARLYGTIPSLDDGRVIANEFGFNITGYPSQVAVVETSINLLNWIPLQTNTLGVGPLSFTDPTSANFPNRFYRARLQ